MGSDIYIYIAAILIGLACAALQPNRYRSAVATLLFVSAFWCLSNYITGHG